MQTCDSEIYTDLNRTMHMHGLINVKKKILYAYFMCRQNYILHRVLCIWRLVQLTGFHPITAESFR